MPKRATQEVDPPPDGNRGDRALPGWWISLEEAEENAREKWWTHSGVNGIKIPVRQYDESGPKDRPIWLFENGDMYLGPWKLRKKSRTNPESKKKYRAHPVEDGLGITYNYIPRGKIFIGEFKNGFITGIGMAFWLKSCSTWKSNKMPKSYNSEIRKGATKLPYCYTGKYVDSLKNDPSAMVTLKDGTTRVGPWRDGNPCGDWWKDHKEPDSDDEEPMKPPPRKRRVSKPAPKDPSRSRKANPSETSATRPTRCSTRRHSQKETTSTGRTVDEDKTSATRAATCHRQKEAVQQERREEDWNELPTPFGFGGSDDDSKPRAVKQKERTQEKRGWPGMEHTQTPKRRKQGEKTSAASGPPLVISVDDESTIEPAGNHPIAPTVDESEARVQTLCDWLILVFGHDPLRADMESYAQHLLEFGVHSPDLVHEYLTKEDVEDFEWMKPIHKRVFLKNAGLGDH